METDAFLDERYLLSGETKNDMFLRVARTYESDHDHGNRLYNYMLDNLFLPATPILSNGGTVKGLPISCFVNETEDSLKGIVELWNESVYLSTNGGGVGSYWGNLRAIGQTVRGSGKTSGIIPFIVVQNSLSLAISQGLLRRGSTAVFLSVEHPEIEEFLELRKPTGGDPTRKALNIHHGIIITDEFMEAVQKDSVFNLRDPSTHTVIETVNARDIWQKILLLRLETGEPYIIFKDVANRGSSKIYKYHGLEINTSNLCTEIMLATGKDQLGNKRTGVCCLASLNLEKYNVWGDDQQFITDVMDMLDNVLSDFCNQAPSDLKNAVYSVTRERSIGLGVMGFHTWLQKNSVAFESESAKIMNINIFSKLKSMANHASGVLAVRKGSCLDAESLGIKNERFVNKLAIAPTASISIIAGNVSAGIDPIVANSYISKNLSGSNVVHNKELAIVLEKKGKNTGDVWSHIASNNGSVQDLDFLDDHEKEVFKTAFEIDQNAIIDLAATRTEYICQSQPVNLFFRADVSKSELAKIHFKAWKAGLKSLYYVRSRSLQRAENISCSIGCSTCE